MLNSRVSFAPKYRNGGKIMSDIRISVEVTKAVGYLLAIAFGCTVQRAFAQADKYPVKPVRLVMPFTAGSQTDALSSEDRYVLASVVLKFNLFSGGADRAGLAGARERRQNALAGKSLAEQRIRLEVQQALQEFEVAEASLGTAAKRVEAATGAFRIAERKRDLGQINQAEFVDARRLLTDARLNLNLTRFTALGSLANLEYAVGPGRRSLIADNPS